MSAFAIVIAKLKAVSAVTSIVTTARIYPGEAPELAPAPYLIIDIVGETDKQYLVGDGRYYESRVSIQCLADTMSAANALGEAVKTAFLDVVKATIAGKSDVDIWKEGTDVSDSSDPRSLKRRTLDYYVCWKGA